MSKNTVTQLQIDGLMADTEFEVKTFYDKVTVVVAKLPNSFTIVESSACVDPANYNKAIGVEICKERIANQLWQLEGICCRNNCIRQVICNVSHC